MMSFIRRANMENIPSACDATVTHHSLLQPLTLHSELRALEILRQHFSKELVKLCRSYAAFHKLPHRVLEPNVSGMLANGSKLVEYLEVVARGSVRILNLALAEVGRFRARLLREYGKQALFPGENGGTKELDVKTVSSVVHSDRSPEGTL